MTDNPLPEPSGAASPAGTAAMPNMAKSTRYVIGGGLIMVLFAAALLIDGPGMSGGGEILGYGILFAVPVCMILYFFFLQGKNTAITIISMVAALLVCGLVMAMKSGSKILAVQDEAKILSQIEFDKSGNLILPPDMDQTNPISKTVTKYATDMAAIQNSVKLDMEASGMTQLFDAQGLSRDDAILRDCARVIALAPKMEKHKEDTIGASDKLRRDVNRLDIEPEMRKGLLEGLNGTGDAMARLDKMWTLQGDMVKEAHGLCLTLARRNWKAKGGVFNFTSRSDMNSFQDRMARLDGINKQITAMQKAGAAELRVQDDQLGAALNPN